jgi:Cys-tRNA(Pro)/Cys-tRNA(Cys) deacylase
MTAASTRAIDAARRAGVPHTVHEYETEGPAAGRAAAERAGQPGQTYGEAAAEALGAEPERVFKTLIASVDGHLAAAIVPVTGELDLKRLAAALGGRRATIAEAADAERATGYVIGGISPLGQRRALPTVLDETAMVFDPILVSAGRRGLQLELEPADLGRLTSAIVAPIGRHD